MNTSSYHMDNRYTLFNAILHLLQCLFKYTPSCQTEYFVLLSVWYFISKDHPQGSCSNHQFSPQVHRQFHHQVNHHHDLGLMTKWTIVTWIDHHYHNHWWGVQCLQDHTWMARHQEVNGIERLRHAQCSEWIMVAHVERGKTLNFCCSTENVAKTKFWIRSPKDSNHRESRKFLITEDRAKKLKSKF